VIAAEYALSPLPAIADRAERLVLGCIFIGAPLPERLSTKDFTDDFCRAVWEAITELHEERREINPLTVAYRLAMTGRLERVGSMSNVSVLLDDMKGMMATAEASCVGSYAAIVHDAALRRKEAQWAR
jgi:replicative DNA helicase